MTNQLFRFFLIFFSCLSWFVSFGQDFSFQAFQNEKDSLRRLEMAINGSIYYRRNNLDSLKILGISLINSDLKEIDKVEVALSKRFLGSVSIRTDNIDEGIGLLTEAREIFSKSHSIILLSETENEIGNGYYLQGNFYEAANYYFASIFHGTQSSDATARYNGMIGFGKTVCAIGDTLKGQLFVQEYLERSLKDNKFEAAADACGFLGMIAGQNGKVDLMSAYYTRSILYANHSESKTHQANAITNKAIHYFYNDKVDSAIYLFKESLKIRKEVGATRPIVESFYNLAILNIETNNLPEAKKFAEQGEVLSSERGIRSWQLDCLILLLEIAEKSNDLENVEPIKLDIDRIQNELDEMGTLDERIIALAVDFTSIHDTPIRRSYFWELISAVAIILSSLTLIYSYRPSST
ncbi:MAG: tetratricopeptide repeat protein [Crocinitomicaceae bacterium]|nr:tetratricopeptide repeat protein [Crocinitomicaceae bacterium]